MEDKTPFVPRDVVQHLRELYSTDRLLDAARSEAQNSDQAIGVMCGIVAVIRYLEALAEAKD